MYINNAISIKKYLQVKRFVLIKLDQQNRLLVVACHLDALIVQATRVQRTDEIRNGFALHTNVGRQNVVADLDMTTIRSSRFASENKSFYTK